MIKIYRTLEDKMATRCLPTIAAILVIAFGIGCEDARAVAAEVERIAEILQLRRGMAVADVGAGKGKWTEGLARLVGEQGHIYATEVDDDRIDDIRVRMEKAGLGNFSAVLGDQHDTGLPENCCDAILLRLVYHHFTKPEEMRASIRRALRPGGRLAIIDIIPQTGWGQLSGVPDRGGHGITPDDLLDEMTGDGFEAVGRFDDWGNQDDHFCIVFRDLQRPITTADPAQ